MGICFTSRVPSSTVTMTSIHQRLQSASAQNTSLLNTISETEYSVSAFQQSNQYIASLKKDIAAQEKKLGELNRHVDREYADHKKYRDSHMKRLAFKLGGKKEKFQADASGGLTGYFLFLHKHFRRLVMERVGH